MKRGYMNKQLLSGLAAVVLFALTLPVHGTDAAKTQAENEAAVRENVKQMEAGWNAKKGEQFARPFTEDADYVVINGLYIKGRTTIGKSHQQIFDTIYKNTTLSLSVRQVRFLRPDVALVHVDGHLEGVKSGGHAASNASMTLVMTRGKEGWQIAAFQNTEVEDH